jgi:hypothetical protein
MHRSTFAIGLDRYRVAKLERPQCAGTAAIRN